ncbi:ImmA/IrrE family metallo-endopeptidase [Paenibacillus radicis (ex Xue et al. 2023)]|uniref:ImmA/IrrE family metallo-endopeptidase n=1 Tax=Paenibacillus radicis (ex Xue et al. 2023) TaxID=2972489 RepID=A0ABT1YRI1_9BACL|nr:ImmA/IrrE family metallo-endopeptidase [Paenibacillus radicis (ex Xue et al. 2023)]MCR8635776.1 ImmA/IrrE family metallo-endopeptidase [Paenibacillus radicis (ex Xue et al. 2023)]
MAMIKNMVKQLVSLHGTNEPQRIASLMQIIVFYEEFKNVWGYFNTSRRIMMIHVNRNLDETLQRFVIAHELGHRVLHPKVNVPFLKSNTLQSIDRIEREANQFAVELLIPDNLLLEGISIYEAASICGVPEEIADLKSRSALKHNSLSDEHSYLNL